MYKIHVFDEVFFPLCKCCYETEIASFPISIENIVKEINSFNAVMLLINTDYPWKDAVKQTKINQEKIDAKLYLLLDC